MASGMTWTGTGGLGTRLGRLAALAKRFLDEANTIPASMGTVIGAFDDTDLDFIPHLAGAEATLVDMTLSGQLSIIREDFRNVIIQMTNAIAPLPALTIEAALPRLRAYMIEDAQTFKAVATTVTGALVSGATGTGSVVVSKTDLDGNDLQLVRAETIRLTCIEDGQIDVGNAGLEIFSVEGEAERSYLDRLWPGGSGMREIISVLSAALEEQDGVGRNLLRSSGFEDFTSNDPDNWEITAGTAGVHIFEQATPLKGDKALKFTGNGSTNPGVRQKLNGTGTNESRGRMRPGRRYCGSFGVRYGGAAPTTGVLQVSVKDSGGTVIDSTTAKATITLSTAASSYTLYSFSFNSPAVMSDTYYFHIETTTAIDSGKDVYMDDFRLAEMPQVRTRNGGDGPFFMPVAGGTDFVVGDELTVTVTNDLSSANMLYWIDRFCGLYANGVRLPVDASPSMADSLIAL